MNSCPLIDASQSKNAPTLECARLLLTLPQHALRKRIRRERLWEEVQRDGGLQGLELLRVDGWYRVVLPEHELLATEGQHLLPRQAKSDSGRQGRNGYPPLAAGNSLTASAPPAQPRLPTGYPARQGFVRPLGRST